MMRPRRWLVVLLAAAACSDPAGIRSMGEGDPAPDPLVPIAPRMLDKCLAVEELRSACPTRVPAVDDSGYRDSHAFDQRDVWGFSAQWGAPYEGLKPKNAPPRFAHVTLMAGEVSQYVPYSVEPKGGGKVPDARDRGLGFGSRTWNGRRGELFLAPPYNMGGGMNGDHLVFRWTEGGRDYLLSLHAWDRLDETEAMLKAIVESLPSG